MATILLVDDDSGWLSRFGHLLRERGGYTVIEASSPELAMPHVGKADLVLTDMIMNRGDASAGLKLAREVRRVHPTKPVAILSMGSSACQQAVKDGVAQHHFNKGRAWSEYKNFLAAVAGMLAAKKAGA